MTEEKKEPGKIKVVLTKVHEAAKQQIAIPFQLTQQTIEAVKIMKLIRQQAGEYCYIMDGFLDPADLNESIVKIEMGLAYLKRANAEDRLELINDMIRELKNTRTIAKRMDARYEEETLQEELQES